jgi:hypothetical protein
VTNGTGAALPGATVTARAKGTGVVTTTAIFSPDASTLFFVNIYSPGSTLAITGPWLQAAL